MAARMSLEDQIKFLLSCVKWSVNGKVRQPSHIADEEDLTYSVQIDFDQVASECEVVTKGAAYEMNLAIVTPY